MAALSSLSATRAVECTPTPSSWPQGLKADMPIPSALAAIRACSGGASSSHSAVSARAPLSSPTARTPLQGHLFTYFGSHRLEQGTLFRVHAPKAQKAEVLIKEAESERAYPMRSIGEGNWQAILNTVKEGDAYQYLITTADGTVNRKVDPFGLQQRHKYDPFFQYETLVTTMDQGLWTDHSWIEERAKIHSKGSPLSLYMIHSLLWNKHNGHFLSFTELAEQITEHCKALGFTHVHVEDLLDYLNPERPELCWLPFTPLRKLGNIYQLQQMINHLHTHGIGVLMRFPLTEVDSSEFGLSCFDGSALFHEEAVGCRRFSFESSFVSEYLTSAMSFWSQMMHIDGFVIEVDDVLLSNTPLDSYTPEPYGGYTYHAGATFLQRLTRYVKTSLEGTLLVARAKRPFSLEGFDYKIASQEPSLGSVEKRFLPDKNEPVMRTLSHILPPSEEDDPKALSFYLMQISKMICLPGAKYFEMGEEIGQHTSWRTRTSDAHKTNDHYMTAIDWGLTSSSPHKLIMTEIAKLHRLYKTHPALAPDAPIEFLPTDAKEALCYQRTSTDKSETMICIHNMDDKEVSFTSACTADMKDYEICYNSSGDITAEMPQVIPAFTTIVLTKKAKC